MCARNGMLLEFHFRQRFNMGLLVRQRTQA